MQSQTTPWYFVTHESNKTHLYVLKSQPKLLSFYLEVIGVHVDGDISGCCRTYWNLLIMVAMVFLATFAWL